MLFDICTAKMCSICVFVLYLCISLILEYKSCNKRDKEAVVAIHKLGNKKCIDE